MPGSDVAVAPAASPVVRSRSGAYLIVGLSAVVFLSIAWTVVGGMHAFVSQGKAVADGPNKMYDGLTDAKAVAYGATNTAYMVGAPMLWIMGRSNFTVSWQGALAKLGFVHLRSTWPHAAWAIVVKLAAVFAFIGLVELGLAWTGAAGVSGRPSPDLMGLSTAGIVGLSVAAGVSEEAFFRGFLLPRVGLVAQAILFALVHIGGGSLWQMLVAAIAGVVYGLVARTAGSIWPGIIAHAAWDIGAFSLSKGGA